MYMRWINGSGESGSDRVETEAIESEIMMKTCAGGEEWKINTF